MTRPRADAAAFAAETGHVAFLRDWLEGSIPERFEAMVAIHPDRLAVRSGGDSLSYRELDELANRIAHGILARRGPASEPIGLLLPQGTTLVAAILGVLKAGKLYVPLDQSHPLPRTRDLADESGTPLIVTDRGRTDLAPPLTTGSRQVAAIDDLITGQPDTRPGLPLSGDTLAYIYYTSGSTGHPKGVYDNQRNVLHNVMRYTNSLRIGPADRLTLLQAPTFSGAVSSLFSAVLNGAAVFPYDAPRDGIGRNLGDWLVRERLTIYHSVPALFRSFLTGDARFPAIRLIRLEGDAASRLDVELFRKHFGPDCVLVNGLGATETGLTRQFFLRRDTPLDGGVVPIGYPTADMHAMLLGDDGRELGSGVVGQVAVRSRYLALGYWRQPELTDAAFRPGPAGSSERTYLSGDLGRFRADGCLEYLGRRDAGFKIRGNRVEPAEVERALLGLAAVREAAVASREDPAGNHRLVAYVVPAATPPIPAPVLRQALAAALPEYLVPTRFVYLDRLPLSENGKVDRRRLPAPETVPLLRAGPYVAPRDDLEERLARHWEEVLHVQPVGVTDNFFDLGGDSLLAASLLAHLEELSPEPLPPTALVTAPTIDQLARVIRTGAASPPSLLVPLRTGGTRPPFFCVVEHGGTVHSAFAAWAGRLSPEQPFHAFRASGTAPGEVPLTTIAAIAAANVAALRRVQAHGPYHLGGRCFGAVVALEMAHHLLAADESVATLLLLDATPLDFPDHVAPAAFRRFRRLAAARARRQTIAEVAQRPWWKRGPYLLRALLRNAAAAGFAATVRRQIRHRQPLPADTRLVRIVNQQAFARHHSRPFPGRITLVLRADDRTHYSADPARDWDRLAAGGYAIHFLDGSDADFSQEPQPRLLAGLLEAAVAQEGQRR
ncbi:MAG: AMP-binding protein [Gemmatimonadales bacterium]